jgi:hypothetical protein
MAVLRLTEIITDANKDFINFLQKYPYNKHSAIQIKIAQDQDSIRSL